MVWVIQRDFLQGKSTQAALDEALAPVPNPKHEPSIDQVGSDLLLIACCKLLHLHEDVSNLGCIPDGT
jgi:hypothetical protein